MTDAPTEYDQLVQKLFAMAGSCRQPISGAFELTNRCNLSCGMCYVRQSAGNLTRQKDEIPAAAWNNLARQAVDRGMLFLLLTGGEVFVRPDFFEIYEPLTRMGLVITLFTNGTLITPETAERVAQAPPSRTEITLYGATAATYEAVTGVRGSYEACCRGIETLVRFGVPLAIKTTITRQNVGELAAMRQMAQDWDVPFFSSSLLIKRSDGAMSDVDTCRVSAADCVALEATDKSFGKRWTGDIPTESPTVETVFRCNGGKASFAVNSQGKMSPCLDFWLPGARPFEIGFQAAWEEVVQFVDSAPVRSHVCQTCEYEGFCELCPGWSLRESGTLDKPVEYLCDIACARKEHFRKRA